MNNYPEFEVHRLNESGLKASAAIGEAFSQLLDALMHQGFCDVKTREFSIVKTKLEEACFFAKKSMAKRADMQQHK